MFMLKLNTSLIVFLEPPLYWVIPTVVIIVTLLTVLAVGAAWLIRLVFLLPLA